MTDEHERNCSLFSPSNISGGVDKDDCDSKMENGYSISIVSSGVLCCSAGMTDEQNYSVPIVKWVMT